MLMSQNEDYSKKDKIYHLVHILKREKERSDTSNLAVQCKVKIKKKKRNHTKRLQNINEIKSFLFFHFENKSG